MLGHFPAPVLSVASDVVKDLEGGEALHSLWALFTKCKDSLRDGRRLENISWRLWYREMELHPVLALPASPDLDEKSPFVENENERLHPPREIYRPVSPISPVLDNDQASILSSSIGSTSSARPHLHRAYSSSSAVGKIICEVVAVPAPERIAPLPVILPPPAATKETPPPRPPTLSLPNSLRPEGTFPQVVVVNPTPHPTPPATPLLASSPLQFPLSESPSSLSSLPPPAISPTACQPQHTPQPVTSPRSPSPPPPPVLSASPVHDPTLSYTRRDETLKPSDRAQFLAQVAAVSHNEVSSPPPNNHASSVLVGEPVPVAALASSGPKASPSEKSDIIEPGTSVTSQSSKISRASTTAARAHTATKRGMATAAGKASKGKVAANASRHGHVARPPLMRQHSTGAKGLKGSKMALTALRRTTSAADTSVAAPPPLQPLQPVQEGEKRSAARLPAPLVTSTANATVAPAPPSAKSTASRTRQPPPPMRRGSSGKGKTTKRSNTRGAGRAIVAEDDSDGCETDKANNGSDDEGDWEEETPEQRAAEARKQKELARRRAAEAEEQRKKDMFRKLPVRSYTDLQRTQSAGLLSRLLNPNPYMFPDNHPYRVGFSTEDLSRLPQQQRQQQPRSPLHPQGGLQALRPAGLQASKPRVSPPTAHPTAAFAAPMLTKSKSGAALPEMVQVNAQVATSAGTKSTRASPRGTNGSLGYHNSRGRPQGMEMEDDSDSDDDDENQIQVASSVAMQRLAAIKGDRKRGLLGLGGGKSRAATPAPVQPALEPNVALLQHLPTNPPPPPTTQSDSHLPDRATRPGIASMTSEPIPMMTHPYNLPAPAPPTTPRTTRRAMLQTELTESLRHNLLWERQISRVNLGQRQRGGVLGAGAGLQPLTTLGAAAGEGSSGLQQQEQQQKSQSEEERRRQQQLRRQRSWGDDFHARGW